MHLLNVKTIAKEFVQFFFKGRGYHIRKVNYIVMCGCPVSPAIALPAVRPPGRQRGDCTLLHCACYRVVARFAGGQSCWWLCGCGEDSPVTTCSTRWQVCSSYFTFSQWIGSFWLVPNYLINFWLVNGLIRNRFANAAVLLLLYKPFCSETNSVADVVCWQTIRSERSARMQQDTCSNQPDVCCQWAIRRPHVHCAPATDVTCRHRRRRRQGPGERRQ